MTKRGRETAISVDTVSSLKGRYIGSEDGASVRATIHLADALIQFPCDVGEHAFNLFSSVDIIFAIDGRHRYERRTRTLAPGERSYLIIVEAPTSFFSSFILGMQCG